MFQLQLYQVKIMSNYCNNLNQVLKEQLTGININQQFQQNQYLHFLIDPSFQGVNKLFVLSFENENDGKGHKGYYLPKLEIKY